MVFSKLLNINASIVIGTLLVVNFLLKDPYKNTNRLNEFDIIYQFTPQRKEAKKFIFASSVVHTNGLLLPPAVFFSRKAIIILESKCWVVQYLLESSSKLFTKQRSHKGTLKVIRIINTKARIMVKKYGTVTQSGVRLTSTRLIYY